MLSLRICSLCGQQLLKSQGALSAVWLAGRLPHSNTKAAQHCPESFSSLCTEHSHVPSYANVLFFKIPISDSFIYSSSSWLNGDHRKAALLCQHLGMAAALGFCIHRRAVPSLLIGLSFSLREKNELKVYIYIFFTK